MKGILKVYIAIYYRLENFKLINCIVFSIIITKLPNFHYLTFDVFCVFMKLFCFVADFSQSSLAQA